MSSLFQWEDLYKTECRNILFIFCFEKSLFLEGENRFFVKTDSVFV